MIRILVLAAALAAGAFSQTFAERLGYPKDARVLILHMDDAGMSLDSNLGMLDVLEHGAAKSLSVMMPCPWVPQMVRIIKDHPDADAGLHLTLTSEWKDYRWVSLAAQPGLQDPEGALWRSVEGVVQHAKPEEVSREIRAQLDRAEKMGSILHTSTLTWAPSSPPPPFSKSTCASAWRSRSPSCCLAAITPTSPPI